MDYNEKLDDLLRLMKNLQNNLKLKSDYLIVSNVIQEFINIDNELKFIDIESGMFKIFKDLGYLEISGNFCRLTVYGLKFIQDGGFVAEQKYKVSQIKANDAATKMTKQIIILTWVFIAVTVLLGIVNFLMKCQNSCNYF